MYNLNNSNKLDFGFYTSSVYEMRFFLIGSVYIYIYARNYQKEKEEKILETKCKASLLVVSLLSKFKGPTACSHDKLLVSLVGVACSAF